MTRSLIFCICVGWLADLPTSLADQTDQALFDQFVEDYWQFRLRESPLFATSTGDHRYNDRLGSVSLADSKSRNEANQEFSSRLNAVESENLSLADQVNHAILSRVLSDELAEYQFGTHLMPITQRNGFHIEFPQLYLNVPLESLTDYENYLARLRAFLEYTNGHLELLRGGIGSGYVLPAVVLEGWETPIDAQIVTDPEQSTLYEPFKVFPTTIPDSEHERLRDDARGGLAPKVVPSYQKLR